MNKKWGIYQFNTLMCLSILMLSLIGGVGNTNAQVKHQLQGTVQINYVDADSETSFLEGGVSPLRYDNRSSNVHVGQFALNYRARITSTLSATIDAHYYDDVNNIPDITQAVIRYSPLPIKGYRLRAKAGSFIPTLSLENTRPSWLSNGSYTNSAINTWIGEELRSNGLGVSLTRPGRRFRSRWSWTVDTSIFKGNDAAGTLLAFRGWALHDRQTGFNERVPFAELNSFSGPSPLTMQAREFDLIDEIDGRWGFSYGLHARYLSRFEFKFTRYDNNADSGAFSDGQWAWDTQFNHVALKYNLSRNTTFFSQFLTGTTEAGNNWLVKLDYEAFYIGGTYKKNDHQVTVRYDNFETVDRDLTPNSDNSGDGISWTAYYQYSVSKPLSVGLEFINVVSTQEGREPLIGTDRLDQRQITLGATYRF